MRKTFLNIIGSMLLLSMFLVGCYTGGVDKSGDNQKASLVSEPDCDGLVACNDLINAGEETTITVPIHGTEIRILRANNETQQASLSEANVKELESWWDSLPKPVQSQIKANQIDIEVVSKIRSNNQSDINPSLNDSQIENTGATLEQIIGKETGMTYTISTTLIDEKIKDEQEHATNIRLVKQMPVKLQNFATDIFLRKSEVSNDNIRTLQYWWTNLPEDIRNKVKTRELTLDLVCHSVNDMDKASEKELATAEEFVGVMGDVLNRMVGVYKVGKKEFSLAKIKTLAKLESANAKNVKFPAKQYVKINLRKNKNYMPTPL
jgi:hypothetical protein